MTAFFGHLFHIVKICNSVFIQLVVKVGPTHVILLNRVIILQPILESSIKYEDVLVAHCVEHPSASIAINVPWASIIAHNCVLELNVKLSHEENKVLL